GRRGTPPPPFLAPKRPRSSLPWPPPVLPDPLAVAPDHRTAAAAANRRRRPLLFAEPPLRPSLAPTEPIPEFLSMPWSFSPTSPTPPVSPHAGFRPPAPPLFPNPARD